MRWYVQSGRPSPLDAHAPGPLSADDSGAAVAAPAPPIGPPGRRANFFWPSKTDNYTTLHPDDETDEGYGLPVGQPIGWGYRAGSDGGTGYPSDAPEQELGQAGFDAMNLRSDVQAAPKNLDPNPPDMKPRYSLFAARPARYFLTGYRSPREWAAQDRMLGAKDWQDPSVQTPYGVEMESEGFRRNRDRSEPSFYGDYVPQTDDGIQFPSLY